MGWMKDGGVDILKQADEMSCGLCCVGMALHHFTSVQWQESALKGLSRSVQGTDVTERYTKSAKNVAGAVPTVGVQMGEIADNVGDGTYGNHLTAMLNKEHLQATFGTGSLANIKTAMRAVDGTHLVIVRVDWNGNGGHWVLVKGRATHFGGQSTYTIHDPAGHLVQNNGSTTYTAPYGGGTFNNVTDGAFWVEVTGTIASKLASKATGVKVM